MTVCPKCMGYTLLTSDTDEPWVATDPDIKLTIDREPVQCPDCHGTGQIAPET